MFNRSDTQPPGPDPGASVTTRLGPVGWLATTVVVGALYYLLIKLSTLLYSPNASIAPLFPHMGFAIAVFIIGGMRLWPGILAGSMAGNYYLGASENGALIAGLISISMVAQALVAAGLMGRQLERPLFLIPERSTLKAVFVTGPVAAVIAPTGSVLTLYWLSSLDVSAAIPLWLTWWASASTSILLFTPLFLLLWPDSYPTYPAGKLRYASWLLFAALAVAAGSVALERAPNREGEAIVERVTELIERRLPAVGQPLSPFSSLVRFIEANQQVDKASFAAFAQPLIEQPQVTAVAWLITKPGERTSAPGGSAGFSVQHSLGDGDIDLAAYLRDNTDLLQRARRAAADGEEKVVSALVEQPGDGPGNLLLARATGGSTIASGEPEAPTSLVVSAMDPAALLLAPLEQTLDKTGARFQVRDVTGNGPAKLVAGGLGGDLEPFWQREVEVADRRWRLELGLPVEYWWWPRETLINRLYLLLGVMIALFSAYLVLNTRTLEHRQQLNERRWREREARLAAIIESPPEAIVAVDTSFHLLNFNRAFKHACQQTFGHTPRIGAPVESIFNVDTKTKAKVYDRFSRALAGEQIVHEATLLDELGQDRLCECTYNPIVHADGEVFGVSVIIRDITAQSRMEAALKRQVEELRRWRQSILGRESRILELKREVNDALTAAGQPPRYRVTSAGEGS